MKKFRVDSFYANKRKKKFFDYERDAFEYGKILSACGHLVFLFRYSCNGKYRLECEIH